MVRIWKKCPILGCLLSAVLGRTEVYSSGFARPQKLLTNKYDSHKLARMMSYFFPACVYIGFFSNEIDTV